ncbi:MAG: cytochrome c biogenesis protein [Synechococcales cyanobacterium CRU_2_2]|nr:cytochrome c biogenesis protein [Synechococcales cyanobacterium CRU_2_2]
MAKVETLFPQRFAALAGQFAAGDRLLLTIAIASISGTVIEQGQTSAFYQANYPEDPALFGFLSWKVLLALGLDHVYRTGWFYAILVLFGSSLTACTFTRQLPTLKSARNWKYYRKPRQFNKLALSTDISASAFDTLPTLLRGQRYQVHQAGDVLYARRGIVGRLGPIIVHASMLLILAGAIWGSLSGFFAQEMIPQGVAFKVTNIFDRGLLSEPQIPKDWGVKVNRFWIDYAPDGHIDQFYSDLSVIDDEGVELDRQTIHVNKPLRHKGVTFYQADWNIAAVAVRLNNSPTLKFPVGELDTQGQGRLWGTWIPTKPDMSEGVSLVAKDLQGTMLIYGADGKLIGTVRKGMATDIPVAGKPLRLTLVDIMGSTGLQIKADPGIPLVYLGFGLLMVSTLMSYVSHAQVWALREGDRCYIGGRTNRAQVTFERELVEMVETLGGRIGETPPEASSEMPPKRLSSLA